MENKSHTVGIHRLAVLSVSLAAAMVLSYVEYLVPISTAVPGIKIGLANLVVIFLLYRLGLPAAAAVSLTRVVLSNLLFGSLPGMAYSLAGAVLSLSVMALFRRIRFFSEVGVSVLGAVFHNLGQILVACFMMEQAAVFYYLPVLCLTGTVAGIVIGILAAVLVRKVPDFDRTGKKPQKAEIGSGADQTDKEDSAI